MSFQPGSGICSAQRQKDIIVCADDFAVHHSASSGIAQLARLQRITATSAMVLSPRWAQDVALLRELRGHVDVGLHLDWTSEFAQAAGHGMPLGAALRRALLGGFVPGRAESVIARQLDLFEAHWQAPPDFVDGHQHVQQFAGIRQALVAQLERRYARQAVKPYLRISNPSHAACNVKARIIGGLGARSLEALAARAGLPAARQLTGIYDFSGGEARYAALMQRWLEQAPALSILMCHPAQARQPGDCLGAARAHEFSFLAGAQFGALLEQLGVQLVRGVGRLAPIKSVSA